MTLVEQILFIGQGALVTLKYTIGALTIGLSLGISLAIGRRHQLFRWFIDALVSILRGTPLLLQLSFFYFALPGFLGIRLNVWHAGLIAFGLNSAAYVTEIPQVLRSILPALINEVISLLKETAIISIIGELDLTRRAQVVAAAEFSYFMPICLAGAYYYILVFVIERIANKIENVWHVKH
jgi:polar amino acid transport system permease protein